MSESRVLIFAKAPRPGQVKTRLIPELGADGATRVYRNLLSDQANRLGADPRLDAYLFHHPAEPGAWLCEYARCNGYALRPQVGTDLGERMCHAVRMALSETPRVILIGTDSPGMDVAYLQAARDALRGADVVFGPAEDGGYVLLGLKRPLPELFEDIAWGTDRVMAQSRERLRTLGIAWKELPELWDVDRPRDLLRLRAARPDLFSD